MRWISFIGWQYLPANSRGARRCSKAFRNHPRIEES